MAIVVPESARTGARDVVLAETALEAARVWIRGLLRVLAEECRAVEGGWPGTMNEARARSGDSAARRLVALSLPALTHDEHGRVTRITYDEARRLWRASSK